MKKCSFFLFAISAVSCMYQANAEASLFYEQYDLFFSDPAFNGGEIEGKFLFDTATLDTATPQMTFISSNVPEWNAIFQQHDVSIRYVVTDPVIPTLDIWNDVWNFSGTEGMHLEFPAGSAPGIFNTPGVYTFNPTLTDPGYVENWSYVTINGVTAYPDPTLNVTWTVSAVPEPSSYVLMLSALGVMSLWGVVKARRPMAIS